MIVGVLFPKRLYLHGNIVLNRLGQIIKSRNEIGRLFMPRRWRRVSSFSISLMQICFDSFAANSKVKKNGIFC